MFIKNKGILDVIVKLENAYEIDWNENKTPEKNINTSILGIAKLGVMILGNGGVKNELRETNIR